MLPALMLSSIGPAMRSSGAMKPMGSSGSGESGESASSGVSDAASSSK